LKGKTTVIKTFSGFSGADIALIYNHNENLLFVRKQGNIDRNYIKLRELLELNFNVPKIYSKTQTTLDMEYIPGYDIQTYLLRNDSTALVDFIIDTINRFKSTTVVKDYLETYTNKLSKIDDRLLPFKKEELLNCLPSKLEQSLCHGDFTFENIIYAKSNKFFMIDCSTGEYDSWIFDIAKLRQDLDAQWFIRNTNLKLNSILLTIKNNLKEEFPEAFDDNIYILMLLRVLIYCQPHSFEYNLLLIEIKKLWK